MQQARARILIVSPTDSFCGAGQFRHNFAIELKKKGYDIFLAQPQEDTPLQKEERLAGVEHFFFPVNPYENFESFFRDRHMGAAAIGVIRPDLIIFSSGLSPYCYIPFLEFANILDIPYMFIEHQVGEYMLNLPADVKDFIGSCYKKAGSDYVVTVSKHNQNLLRECYQLPSGFGKTITLGRSKEYFSLPTQESRYALRSEWNIPADAFVILTVAKLEVVKGHGFLLQAINELKKRGTLDNIYFVWAGEGSLRGLLQATIDEIQATEHVRLLGHKWNASSLYDGADIFALTSLSEGLPFTLMEAMAKGLPGLCTDAGGTAEGLGDAGVVLGQPSLGSEIVSRLIESIETLSLTPETLKSLSAKARTRALVLFQEERMMSDYVGLIEAKLGTK